MRRRLAAAASRFRASIFRTVHVEAVLADSFERVVYARAFLGTFARFSADSPTSRRATLRDMDSPPWLSDLLELAELLLKLDDQEEARRALDRLERWEIDVGEAVTELRSVH